MRFLLFSVFLILLFPVNSKGQTGELPRVISNDYPRYIKDSASGLTCVVFTIDQAKKLDNDEELLQMYQLLHTSADSLIKSLVFKVKVSDTEVAYLNLEVRELEKVNASEKMLVANLKEQIEDYKKNIALANQQLGLKDEQLRNLNKEIRKLKTMKIVGFSVGALGIIAAIITLL
jgi:hypothetical protein